MIRYLLNVVGRNASKGLRDAADQLPDDLDGLTSRSAEEMLSALRAAAPVGKQRPGGRTPGGLRASLKFDLAGTTATFDASEVAKYVIGGTQAHDIVGNPLAFYWDKKGDTVFFMRVHHPGTNPNDFRIPAIDEAASEAEGMLEDLADTILSRITP